MSFIHTKDQIRARAKTVTRRRGWWFLEPGTVIQAVEKSQGLKKGEKIKAMGLLRVTSVRKEPLRRMIDDTDYGLAECALEGFAGHPQYGWPSVFVEWFAAAHACTINDDVNRIEFEYVDPPHDISRGNS
jgi:hypothetical protein